MIHFCVATAPPDEAPGLARSLVEEGLAACVNILPGARSIYRWEGKVHDDGEAVLLIKTAQAIESFQVRFTELHSYDCPELLAFPVESGLPAYLQWVVDHSSDDPSSPDAKGSER